MRTVCILALIVAVCICSDANLGTESKEGEHGSTVSLYAPGSSQSNVTKQDDSQKSAGPGIPGELGTTQFEYFELLSEDMRVKIIKAYVNGYAFGDFDDRDYNNWRLRTYNRELRDLEKVEGETEEETIKKRKAYISENYLLRGARLEDFEEYPYINMLKKCGIMEYLSEENKSITDPMAFLKWYRGRERVFWMDIESYFETLDEEKRDDEMVLGDLKRSISTCWTMDDIKRLSEKDNITTIVIRVTEASLTLAAARLIAHKAGLL
jgi:hypothetical protein